MRLLVSEQNVGKLVARLVAKRINTFKPTASRPFVLGLPTGSTPLVMYKELIAMVKAKEVSFEHVVTFNMDEYVGLDKNHPQSYHFYMWDNFFKHIDINPHNVHILNGQASDLAEECKAYEAKISAVGGIQLMLGGVGEDGHIAFNEPGSSLVSLTRIKTLNHSTILANSRFFDGDISKTPNLALTIGIGTIMACREVVIMATGASKSLAIYNVIEGSITAMCPISALQMHNKTLIVTDKLAAYELKLKTISYFNDLRDEYYDLEQEAQGGSICKK